MMADKAAQHPRRRLVSSFTAQGWAASLEQHAVAIGQHGPRAGDAEVVMAAQAWPGSLALAVFAGTHKSQRYNVRTPYRGGDPAKNVAFHSRSVPPAHATRPTISYRLTAYATPLTESFGNFLLRLTSD